MDGVVWTTVFGVVRSFQLGMTIMTPWRHIYTAIPRRLLGKLFGNFDTLSVHLRDANVTCARIWNFIVCQMVRDHVISVFPRRLPRLNVKGWFISFVF